MATDAPVDLLVIDGLHDYPAVASDFAAFEAQLTVGARVAFHDYAEYFPGVMALVDELVATGAWEVETAARSLRVLRRTPDAAKMVLPVRIELTTSALPRMRSTTELRQHIGELSAIDAGL